MSPPRPPQEYITCGLHQALSHDDALPVVFISTFTCVGLQYGGTGLLELQQQRVILSRKEQPYKTACANATDTDRFDNDIFKAVSVKKDAALVW